MSAEVLRQAAALMRSRAEAAVCPCGGPVCNVQCGWFGEAELQARFDDWTRPIDHILSWSPALAHAVADWLEAEATALDAMRVFARVAVEIEHAIDIRGAALTVCKDEKGGISLAADTSGPALAVATTYLGTAS